MCVFKLMSTITVFKMMDDMIQFTLPLTSFTFVSTEHMEASDFSVSLFVRNGKKFFTTTYWTCITNSKSPFNCIQTRFAKYISTTRTEVRVSTGILTYLTNQPVRRFIHKLIVIPSSCLHTDCSSSC